MKNLQWQLRSSVLIPALVVGIPLTIVFTGLTCYFYHPVRVWLADGKWCTQFSPDGPEKILYSEECSGFAPRRDR
ncbi:hypothetical protein H6F89_29600 [Cyanobacteria bacterium FACHB-63]|nr:hypothetical protein [Cyanobacteria bacterium FACHB-63]